MLIVRGVLYEVGRSFALALAATTGAVFFLLSIRFMQRTPGVGMGFLVEVFPLFFPMALEFAVPMAVLTGTVMTFSRMAIDGELAALGASGVPLRTLTRPVLACAACVALGAFVLTDFASPFAASRLEAARKNLPQHLKTSFRAGLSELEFESGRVSFESFQGDRFEDLCVEWRRTPEDLELWRAERGAIAITNDNRVVIELENVRRVLPWDTKKGDVFLAARDVVIERSLSEVMQGPTGRARSAMASWELAYVVERGVRRGSARTFSASASGELAQRTALASSAFLFALIGIPFGILGARAGRVGACLVAITPVAVAYIACVMAGFSLARDGTVPPYPALWAGNALLFAVGAPLLLRVARR
jgi:lipopolysaccharide export LptBFGC system permease protein LptF